jgi:hypothetical protein
MEKIAHTLGVTLGEFFVAAGAGEGSLIVRAGHRCPASGRKDGWRPWVR